VISITRAVLPEELEESLTQYTGEIARTVEHRRTVYARELWRSRRATRQSLNEILRDMAPGREYCMYCGDNQGTSVDHYEPLSRNPLRTFDWLNHLLACARCNSHEKRDRFPVDGVGAPLLIDPTVDDPFDHLLLTLSLGEYRPLTKRGEATIDVCGLNRPLLVRGRAAARPIVEACVVQWSIAEVQGDTAAMAYWIHVVREQPFADVCQSMLRQAMAPGAAVVFADQPWVLDMLREPELRAALLVGRGISPDGARARAHPSPAA
jgi:hypothetical protein